MGLAVSISISCPRRQPVEQAAIVDQGGQQQDQRPARNMHRWAQLTDRRVTKVCIDQLAAFWGCLDLPGKRPQASTPFPPGQAKVQEVLERS